MTVLMPCPACGHSRSDVWDSRVTKNNWQRRRRKCGSCGNRWTTIELPEEFVDGLPGVIKGIRSARDKLDAMIKEIDKQPPLDVDGS